MTDGLRDDDAELVATLLAVSDVLALELDRRLRAEHGIARFEFAALAALGDDAYSAITMGDLAMLLNASASRLSHAMDRLVDRGLVTRIPSADDRRSVLATLTPAGAELLREAAPTFDGLVGELVLARLDVDGRRALLDALRGLAAGLCRSHRDDAAASVSP